MIESEIKRAEQTVILINEFRDAYVSEKALYGELPDYSVPSAKLLEMLTENPELCRIALRIVELK